MLGKYLVFLATSLHAHPLMIRCYCGVTISDEAQVISGQWDPDAPKELKAQDCLGDVFGETGIRWYINGPFDPNIPYTEEKPREYKIDRASQRLGKFGYKCEAIQLLDPAEEEYIAFQ